MSCCVHDIPGRLRIRIPLLKGNDVEAKTIEQIIGAIEGVDSCFPSTLTGSVLVLYDHGKVTSRKILNVLKEKQYLDASKAVNYEPYAQPVMWKVGEAVGKALFSFAVNRALSGTPFSFLSILI